jgi:hypothetical protein
VPTAKATLKCARGVATDSFIRLPANYQIRPSAAGRREFIYPPKRVFGSKEVVADSLVQWVHHLCRRIGLASTNHTRASLRL